MRFTAASTGAAAAQRRACGLGRSSRPGGGKDRPCGWTSGRQEGSCSAGRATRFWPCSEGRRGRNNCINSTTKKRRSWCNRLSMLRLHLAIQVTSLSRECFLVFCSPLDSKTRKPKLWPLTTFLTPPPLGSRPLFLRGPWRPGLVCWDQIPGAKLAQQLNQGEKRKLNGDFARHCCTPFHHMLSLLEMLKSSAA